MFYAFFFEENEKKFSFQFSLEQNAEESGESGGQMYTWCLIILFTSTRSPVTCLKLQSASNVPLYMEIPHLWIPRRLDLKGYIF